MQLKGFYVRQENNLSFDYSNVHCVFWHTTKANKCFGCWSLYSGLKPDTTWRKNLGHKIPPNFLLSEETSTHKRTRYQMSWIKLSVPSFWYVRLHLNLLIAYKVYSTAQSEQLNFVDILKRQPSQKTGSQRKSLTPNRDIHQRDFP